MRGLGEIRGYIIRMFASRSMEKDESPGGFAIPERKRVSPQGDFSIPERKGVSPRGDLQFSNKNGLVPGGICNSQTETH